MSRNGSGTYTLPAGQPVSTGTVIDSTVHNTFAADVAAALTDSLTANGEKTATANQPMGSFRHTGVGHATARNQYAAADQVQKSSLIVLGSVVGTDTITGSMTPALNAYSAGMAVIFTPANTNTGAVTISIDGLAALDIQKGAGVALAAGDLAAGVPVMLLLDSGGDDFILQGATLDAQYAKLGAANTFAANQMIQVAGDTHLTLRDSTAAVDEKGYRIRSIAGQFAISLLDDAGAVVANLLVANRTTSTVDTLVFSATAMSLGANAVLTAVSNLPAANLTGTIADARFPATLPAVSGANLTALNAAQLTTGTIADARFPSVLPGIASSAKIPVSSTSGTLVAGDAWKCVDITADIAVPNSTFTAGDVVTIYNNSSTAKNITRAAGTQYKAGTDGDDASISLAARGFATIRFRTATEWTISGNVT
jgi:hypothetical protein